MLKATEELVAGAGFAPGCPARRPSGRPSVIRQGHAAHVQNRIVQGCTGAVQHRDVRKRLPDDFVNH